MAQVLRPVRCTPDPETGHAISSTKPDERAFIHEEYVNELLNNVFLPEARDRLRSIVTQMKERDCIHVQRVIAETDESHGV